MKHLEKIDSFYNSLRDIEVVNNNLDYKRELLRKELNLYNKKIENLTTDKNLQNQNNEIGKLLNLTIGNLKDSSKEWADKFNNILEKEKFRSDLENYFIVIIFGKVKAGKSSLGNFIAEHRPKSEKVSFFKYDEAGKEKSIKKLEEIEEDSFDTNNLECTSNIQGFKLNAMAWIDTPGLGSMTLENGKLAKEYIQSADYIIYPTSSDSPLQRDEVEELKRLFEQNKKVTICITKSDKFERKKDKSGKYIRRDGKIAKFLVNKSLEDRNKQEGYVREEIKKINKNNSLLGDIISISVHTAKLGLKENSEKLFIDSSIPKFYELLTEVVKEKASKLKSETPYSSLKSFIDNDILGVTDNQNSLTIKAVREKIDDLDKNIVDNLKRFDILISNIESDLSREIENVIAKYYMKIDKYNSKEMFDEMSKEIANNISKITENNIKKAFKDFSYSVDSLSSSMSGNNFKIEDRYEEFTYTTETRNKGIGSAILGGLATIGTAIATGGSSLIITTGASLLAGGAGGYIGGKIGEMTGGNSVGRVKVGDNKDELIQEFKEKQLLAYKENTKKIYENIQNQFFIPLQNIVKNMRIELDNFEKNIISFEKGLS